MLYTKQFIMNHVILFYANLKNFPSECSNSVFKLKIKT